MGGSGSGKTSTLLNLINYEPDIDNIYLYAKDTYELKHQLLISKRERTCIKHFKDSKAFIKCSNVKMFIQKMIADILSNKKFEPIFIKLFIHRCNLNISFISITQSYLAAPKIVTLNSTDCFILKILKES